MTDSHPNRHKQKGNSLGDLIEDFWGWVLQAQLDQGSHMRSLVPGLSSFHFAFFLFFFFNELAELLSRHDFLLKR